MNHLYDHGYLLATVVFTVYSQLIMRWQVAQAGELPGDVVGKLAFVGHLLLNPWVLTSIVSTLLAGISWMLAMSRFDISYAYPWISLNFVLLLLLGVLLFDESLSLPKVLGTLLVVAGVAIVARS